MKKQVILSTFFIAGIIFRLWFIRTNPQPIVYDQIQYQQFALEIISHGGFYAHQFRTYGYPILLTPIYILFGANNPLPWQVIQAVMDTATGLLIYFLGKRLFHSSIPAWLGYGLYLFNPFTSAYVGVLLTEVPAIFFTTLCIYLFVRYLDGREVLILVLLGFFLGFLPQVRPTFFYCDIIALLVVILLALKAHLKWTRVFMQVILAVILFILPFSYNVIGNEKIFHQPALTTVDDFFAVNLYVSTYVDKWPLHATDTSAYPPEVGRIYADIMTEPKTPVERREMAKKYLNLSLTEMVKRPGYYLTRDFKKMWYIWDKNTLFYYKETDTRASLALIRYGNIFLLLGATVGFLHWSWSGFRRNNRLHNSISISVFFLIFYITVVHIFSVSEERFSLPMYPLVILFFGYFVYSVKIPRSGIWSIWRKS